jgi:aminoglycoside phosphotransferase (APT) family kinase protein
MNPRSAASSELPDVARQLGSGLVAAEPVGWGDARATYRLTLADGSTRAGRRFEPGAGDRAHVTGRLMVRLVTAGLPVPQPTVVTVTGGGRWLVTDWITGETGASWLDDPDRARHVAGRMGRLAGRLRALDLADALPDGPAPGSPAASPGHPGAFVHGDFAPVNVIMDAAGEIAALLDLEYAGPGPSLLDVAWWGWVVRHHHPDAWRAAWPTFLAAAGVEPGRAEGMLRDLALQALAARAAATTDADGRRDWLARLETARGWDENGPQAT